jgi:hypothetical protein
MEFMQLIARRRRLLGDRQSMLSRAVNEGFSGGEKKRNEIFQMALLEPKLAILDETDSGLDIDALRIVRTASTPCAAPSAPSSSSRTTSGCSTTSCPDYVHVLSGGRIVKSGGKEKKGWLLELEEKGEASRLARTARAGCRTCGLARPRASRSGSRRNDASRAWPHCSSSPARALGECTLPNGLVTGSAELSATAWSTTTRPSTTRAFSALKPHCRASSRDLQGHARRRPTSAAACSTARSLVMDGPGRAEDRREADQPGAAAVGRRDDQHQAAARDLRRRREVHARARRSSRSDQLDSTRRRCSTCAPAASTYFEARDMLIHAFAGDILDRVRIEPLRVRSRPSCSHSWRRTSAFER